LASLALTGLILIHGCASSSQSVSVAGVEDKVARIELGQTTMAQVETLFGTDRVNDRHRWTYSLADTEFRMSQSTRGKLSAVVPFIPENAATNTRAVISVWFTDDGTVKGLELARYFGAPFVNDYWYLITAAQQNALASVARAGESSGLKVTGLDKAAGTFTLEDDSSKARITVKLETRTLHLTSTNPHDRLSKEYRTFTRKESALTNRISTAAELIQ
jgi:hypothetical protein